MVIRSGTYTGNATITDIIVGDLGGTPDLVLICNSDDGLFTVFALSSAPADHTFYISNDTSHLSGAITALASNKFTIGSGSACNDNGHPYFWLAIRDDGAGDFQVGTYTGTGSAQDVALNFNPNWIWVKSDATHVNETVLYTRDENDTGSNSHKEGFADVIDGITGYGSGGGNHFTVGTRDGTNKSGDTFYFVAAKDVASKFLQGIYTGDASNPRTISGFTGTLTNLFVTATSTSVNIQTRDNIGSGLTIFSNSSYSGGITQLNSGDFHIDGNAKINTNARDYHWYGFIAPTPINTTTSTTTTTSTSTTTTSTSTTTTHSTSTSTTTTSTSTTTTSTSTTTTSTSTSTTTTSTSTTTTSTSTTTTSTSTTHSTSTSTTTTVPYVFRVSQESKEPLNISVRTGTKATL